MKSTLFISILAIVFAFTLLTGCSSSSAQKASPEQVIAAKIKKSFPNFAVVSNNKEPRDGKSVFAVIIRKEQDRRMLIYSSSGTLLEMIQGVQTSALPPAVTKSVQTQYPEGVIFNAQKISRGKTVMYQLAVRNGVDRIELNLDAAGKTIYR